MVSLLLHIREQNFQILQWINKQYSSSSLTITSSLSEDFPVKLPVSSITDLQKIENYLLENTN